METLLSQMVKEQETKTFLFCQLESYTVEVYTQVTAS